MPPERKSSIGAGDHEISLAGFQQAVMMKEWNEVERKFAQAYVDTGKPKK